MWFGVSMRACSFMLARLPIRSPSFALSYASLRHPKWVVSRWFASNVTTRSNNTCRIVTTVSPPWRRHTGPAAYRRGLIWQSRDSADTRVKIGLYDYNVNYSRESNPIPLLLSKRNTNYLREILLEIVGVQINVTVRHFTHTDAYYIWRRRQKRRKRVPEVNARDALTTVGGRLNQ